MPSEFTLDTGAKVVPEDKDGPRVGIGVSIIAARTTAGAIGLQILRGDGGDPEAFSYTVRTRWFAASANVAIELKMADLDLYIPDFAPRSYRLRIVADGGGDLSGIRQGLITTSPYSPAGSGP